MILENNSTTIILCFLSLVTLITGFWFYFNPPKTINILFGYRTKRSMKSQKNWEFAHFYSGKLLILYGAILLVLGLLAYSLNLNNNRSNVIAIILYVIGVIIVIFKTETSIKKKFKD